MAPIVNIDPIKAILDLVHGKSSMIVVVITDKYDVRVRQIFNMAATVYNLHINSTLVRAVIPTAPTNFSNAYCAVGMHIIGDLSSISPLYHYGYCPETP